jgi:hypothetical protein
MTRSPSDRTTAYDRQNVEAAEIILRDVQAHGGEAGGLAIWARAVLRRVREERAA